MISEIAEVHGLSSAQVILRWNLQKGVVVIPGSSNPDHIRKNTEVYHFSLTEDEMARIGALGRGAGTKIPPGLLRRRRHRGSRRACHRLQGAEAQ